jgi:hypothetical protein
VDILVGHRRTTATRSGRPSQRYAAPSADDDSLAAKLGARPTERWRHSTNNRPRAPAPQAETGKECPIHQRLAGNERQPEPEQGDQFPRVIHWVQIDLGDDATDADHFISADERLRIAMNRQ